MPFPNKSGLPQVDTPWLSRHQLAAYLGISVETLKQWRRSDQPPPEHSTPSGRPMFHRDEIDAWLRSRCTTTPKKAPKAKPERRQDPDDDPTRELVG